MSTMKTGAFDLSRHHQPQNLSDRLALGIVKILRFIADTFFAKRYGHRAVVLETIAAVPGMVGGALQHLSSLRRMTDDHGWIRTLLDEAENERMHLMTFVHIAKPSLPERALILFAQGAFFNGFFALYLISPRTAHRMVGYFEEEAVISYTEYLEEIDAGRHENVPAPQIAIDYWKLARDARLRDVVLAIRDDEAGHRDVNHGFADTITGAGRSVATGKAKTKGVLRLGALLVALLFAALLYLTVRAESERPDQILLYEKGVYLGPPDTPLSQETREKLRDRVLYQKRL